MAINKTPDNRLMIPDYLKELTHSPLFRGTRKINIKMPKNVVDAISALDDPMNFTYAAALGAFGEALESQLNTRKKLITYSAVTNKELQLLFAQFTYPLPHLRDIAVVYRTCIYQTAKGVVEDRHSVWSIYKEDNIRLTRRNALDDEMREIIDRYPVNEVLAPFANIALCFTRDSVVDIGEPVSSHPRTVTEAFAPV